MLYITIKVVYASVDGYWEYESWESLTALHGLFMNWQILLLVAIELFKALFTGKAEVCVASLICPHKVTYHYIADSSSAYCI